MRIIVTRKRNDFLCPYSSGTQWHRPALLKYFFLSTICASFRWFDVSLQLSPQQNVEVNSFRRAEQRWHEQFIGYSIHSACLCWPTRLLWRWSGSFWLRWVERAGWADEWNSCAATSASRASLTADGVLVLTPNIEAVHDVMRPL